MNCSECHRDLKAKKFFFSFSITPLLIEVLKEKGFEDIIFFDEKNCCLEMSKTILNAICFLTKKYGGKAATWYRNFIIKKFKKEHTIKLTRKINRNDKKAIDERFYWTYLSEFVCDDNIQLDDFLQSNHKIKDYYKYYTMLDKEIGTRTRLYDFDTSEYHQIKLEKTKEVTGEIYYYIVGEKLIEPKKKKWDYHQALNKITNPKFLDKIKSTIKKLFQNKEIMTVSDHLKIIKKNDKRHKKNQTMMRITTQTPILRQ